MENFTLKVFNVLMFCSESLGGERDREKHLIFMYFASTIKLGTFFRKMILYLVEMLLDFNVFLLEFNQS